MTRSILDNSFSIYQGTYTLSVKSMNLMFAWGITNILKNDNIPFVFFWCDLIFTSELCLIKRHGRPRNVESQPAILSPQSYVFTLLQEERKLKFDCPNINFQNRRQIVMFILLPSIQSTESIVWWMSDVKLCMTLTPHFLNFTPFLFKSAFTRSNLV